MGRRPWASEEQKTWLEGCLPDFISYQQAGTLPFFWSNTTPVFFAKWPMRPPPADTTESKLKEHIATERNISRSIPYADEIKLKLTFYVHSASKIGILTSITVKSDCQYQEGQERKKQPLQPWQAYCRLYYSRHKDTIVAVYQQYVASVPTGSKPKTLFEFRMEQMKELFAMETPEVKVKVEEFHINKMEDVLDDLEELDQELATLKQ